MYQYFVRRLMLGLLTLLLITFLVYALIRLMPGDPLLVMLESARPDKPITTESIERMRAQFGLNDPWYVAYMHWLGGVLHGNFGDSLSRPVRVADSIRQRIGPTLVLEVASLLLTYLLSIPIGLYSSARNGKWDE